MGASRSLAIRAVPLISKSINEGLTDPVDFTLKSVEVARIADIRPPAGGHHAMTIAPSAISADALLLLIDADAIAIFVSALFGADPDMPPVPIERDLSPTELALVNMVFHQIATAVNGTGARSLDIRFPIPPAITGDELVYGYFDGHGWNMAFDHETGMLNGVFDFADSGFGSRHRDLSYSNWISADLTLRIIDRYEELARVKVNRDLVMLYSSALRLAELAEEFLSDAHAVANVVDWVAELKELGISH